MEDRASLTAFVKPADVRSERGSSDGNELGVTQHAVNIFGNLYIDRVENPLTLVLELFGASFIFVENDEGFRFWEHGQEESGNLEIDQAAPYHPNAADFVAAEQALGSQSRAGCGPLRADHGALEHRIGSPRLR